MLQLAETARRAYACVGRGDPSDVARATLAELSRAQPNTYVAWIEEHAGPKRGGT